MNASPIEFYRVVCLLVELSTWCREICKLEVLDKKRREFKIFSVVGIYHLLMPHELQGTIERKPI